MSAPGQQRVTLTGHRAYVRAVAVAPDGTWLATASDDGTARIWDVGTGQQRAALTGHDRAVDAVAVSPDGIWLATASHDGTVRIWDTAARRTRVTMRVENTILACAWLGTAELAAAGSAGLYLFDFLPSSTAASPFVQH